MRARRILESAGAIAIITLASRLFPTAFFLLLGHPAAHLAGWWLNTPHTMTPDGILLMDGALSIMVTPTCSGADFLALLCGIMLPFLTPTHRHRYLWLMGPSAIVITIATNSCRIIAGWYTGLWARHALPETYWGGVHLGTGILLFLTALIAVYAICSRLERNAHA